MPDSRAPHPIPPERPSDHGPASPAAGLPATDGKDWLEHLVDSARLGWSWVPVRSLSARQRPRIAKHLLSLSEADRYLRFGYPATDGQINRYVDTLDFHRDEVFGIFNRRLELIAMAHLAYGPAPAEPASEPAMAEFGVSVLGRARGRGYGARLFDHAVLHARNRGVKRLFVHALSENAAMLKIARNAGARIERTGPESEAILALPADTVASHVGEAVESQAANLNYQLKRHAAVIHEVLQTVAEARRQTGRSGHGAEE